MNQCLLLCRRVFLSSLLCFLMMVPTSAQGNGDVSEQARLNRGEVVVDQKDVGDTKFVVAKILIDAPPEQVWRIMTNPFEFQGKISPRMKDVQVVTDLPELSVLKVTVNIGFFLPPVTYAVESRYENRERIEYRRVGGTLRDFKGSWVLFPVADGRKTQVNYSMFVDPGIPVPQWLVRAGVRDELPRTLTAMRERVIGVFVKHQSLVTRSILAAEAGGHPIATGELHHS
jgi:carbon monoxide dehydrogenase subunit G